MVVGLYLLTFLASLTVLIHLLVHHKRMVTNVVLLSILVTVNALGRCLLSLSETMDMALLANLFMYLGACFCPLIVISILSDYSDISLPRWLMPVLALLSTLVMGLVLTIGHSDIYYESAALIKAPDFHYLQITFGPAHILFPIMLVVYFLVILVILLKALRKQQQIPISAVGLYFILSLIIMGAYFLDQLVHARISYVSMGYFVAMILLLWRVEQINMYDLPTNIASSLQAMNEIGYMEFDTLYRCMGYNPKAREMFPELPQTCPIGKKPVMNDSVLYNEVLLWMYRRKPGSVGRLQLGDNYYAMTVRDIPYGKKACVGYMLELVDRTAEHKVAQSMRTYNDHLKKDVAMATDHISHIKDMMVVGMASMVESRDNSTGGHIKRTYQVMRTFSQQLLPHCKELGISPAFLQMVTRAAPMHDLGKIAIDDAVLKKQGRFDDQDYEIMKKHPEEGAKIVRHILAGVEPEPFVKIAENVAHYHHERWDGKGYPEGLKGEEIPMEARVMALPDVCDALLSKRCYKEAFTYDQVFTLIEENLGTQFDPVLGRYFIQCRPELERMYRIWYEEDRDDKMLELRPIKKA